MLTQFRNIKFLVVVLIYIGSCLPIHAEPQKNIEKILVQTHKKYRQINNLKCRGIVSINIPHFRIPDTEVNFFYREPDDFNYSSSGFTLLPKSQFALKILNNMKSLDYNLKNGTEQNSKILKLKVQSDFLEDTALLNIDARRKLITKIKFQKKKTSFEINIDYQQYKDNHLPSIVKYNFKLSKGLPNFSPPSIQRPFGETELFNKIDDKEMKGSLKIKLSDYQINSSHIDTVFQSREKNN